MKTNSKETRLTHVKAIDVEKRTITAYVSTFDWDRTDDKFAKGAWRLEAFRKNPVVMWAHDYTQPPIAKAIRIEEDEHGLVSEMEFAETERAKEVFELYKGGFLSAFSVGFNPKQYKVEPIDENKKGIVYIEAELLEYSAVPIPANPGALIGREMAELVMKAVGPAAITKIEVDGQEQFMIPQPDPDEIPEKKAAPVDLEETLRSVISLAKMSRKNLGKGQLSMLRTAMDVFQEIIDENQEGVPQELVQKLADLVGEYAKVIENLHPDASLTVRRVMSQVEKAIAAR